MNILTVMREIRRIIVITMIVSPKWAGRGSFTAISAINETNQRNNDTI
ncbi:hypothetical protein [Pararcticibacter amylolyticus]|nr:hypothetical protein [Pararcticibacter amylolyticus]